MGINLLALSPYPPANLSTCRGKLPAIRSSSDRSPRTRHMTKPVTCSNPPLLPWRSSYSGQTGLK